MYHSSDLLNTSGYKVRPSALSVAKTKMKINSQLKDNDILIYMKGSPYEPKCGFSAKTVQALIDCGAEFSYVDILENQDVRQTLPSISDWPTFPQVFLKGELIGGCDIVSEMHEAGDLQLAIDKVLVK